jgi:ribokinase
MRPRILVLGSSNTDLVITSPRLPRPGETLLGGEFRRAAGGKGANQAVAAARAGADVTFIGACGDDDFGHAARIALRREKIRLGHFHTRPGESSGLALILLGGRTKENLIAVARSANDTVSAEDVLRAHREFMRAQVVIAQLETPLPAVLACAQTARRAGVPFVLNPAPARKLPRALLPLTHVLTPNEHEALLLTGETNLRRAGAGLLRAGCRHVVITRGSRGALYFGPGGVKLFPAPKVHVVDTVGAGDCFTAWLAVGVAEQLPLAAAIARALRAASLAVTRAGAQEAMPRREEMGRA